MQAEFNDRNYNGINSVQAFVNDLPLLLDDWGDLEEVGREDAELRWHYLMIDRLVWLDRQYRVNQLQGNQREQYRHLLQSLSNALLIIDKLGFTRPTVRLSESDDRA